MITPEITHALAKEATDVQTAIATLAALPVESQDTLTTMNDWLVKAKTRHKEIEAERVRITKPQNEALRAVNALFKPTLTALDSLCSVLSRKVTEGHRYLEAQQARQLQAAAEQFQAGQIVQATIALNALPEAPIHAGTTVRKVWKFEIDPSLGPVPREYCRPDEQLIRAAVANGVREIPGVRIFEDSSTIVRTK